MGAPGPRIIDVFVVFENGSFIQSTARHAYILNFLLNVKWSFMRAYVDLYIPWFERFKNVIKVCIFLKFVDIWG